jgi:hypothetical protein
VKRLEGKPFALVGVNVMETDPKKLKAALERQKLNWRSFTHKEAIADEWNSPGTPTYYVLDARGVIRYKWIGNPGEKAMDSAIEKLLGEVGKGK